MKQGKRPTRRQKQEIKEAGLIAENWLVERDTYAQLVLINRYSSKLRTIRRAV
ncbi:MULTISPECIES: hypothetical protein [unclassified Paenibacillus]|uniref:DUF6906 family protein n=1 Tax=unclassified Paenibacillus TaxID=185978 RepID=UPI0024740C0D|nr:MULTISPECIES: hypothetical protein [unclassified Paenibacillus]MDH6427234.1 hypothetical protein [Paenibacillus sp. PastH-4]MDH6443263.1 hypothetical protein [Paenibacillus sp. PastF-4]MDH6526032.1 hypothetical protein [Paenibacillus sp. PastH-3]